MRSIALVASLGVVLGLATGVRADTPAGAPGTADVIDRFAEKWIKIDAQAGKNFLELSAFDLSFGPAARAEASGISDTVEGADALDAKVTCVLGLLRLNPTPQVVDTLLERLAGAIAATIVITDC